ncbi:MAG: thiamine-phosphate kinase, partial [Nitrospinaceae bacterium]|nr:thiamine-phosphate kinase [Nitrospinaceae bacterium]NIR56600.1 thiamine-phosphate kinase [Nitrospinaceae bacterium]NIS87062.1 thiamine-phosphate kinase [Nitrospinaceae bacterium]NIT83915.1 thiamine-phosphate kinase [Nitrospinaceae bacterium]NIU46109.1 thiamine-phosphate kinase [Nitrospinaceae bacterium]
SRAKITSMIDVSDGLVQDLGHICEASGVGARLEEWQLPLAPALTRVCTLNSLNALSYGLRGGEEYELLFTSRPEDVKKIMSQFHQARCPVSVVGEITASKNRMILEKTSGAEESLRFSMGFNHFKTGKG